MNKEMLEPKLVIIAGPTGSGKTTVKNALQSELDLYLEKGVPVQAFTIGDVFRALVANRGGNPDDRAQLYAASKELTEKVRSRGVPLWVIKNMPDISWEQDAIIIVDGVRHPDEARRWKEIYPSLVLVYCDCPEEERIRRLCQERGSAPGAVKDSVAQELETDQRAAFLGIGNVIVASPDVAVEETVKEILARIGIPL